METFGWMLMLVGIALFWLGGYMRGLEIGKVRGRLEYRKLERMKRES